MTVGKSPPDPSMEEIIASISRIIAEDKQPADRQVATKASGEAVTPVSVDRSDILDLTQVVEEDGSVRRVSPWAESATAPSGATVSLTDAAGRIEPQAPNADPSVERGLNSA